MNSIIVMNSAMMPKDGVYSRKSIDQDEFVSHLQNADNITSYIGYRNTVDFVRRISGIDLPLNRNITALNDRCTLLVVKLKYRLDDPTKKRGWVPADSDFEFSLAEYRPHGFHTVTVEVLGQDCYQPPYFEVFMDDMRWHGPHDETQRLAEYVLSHSGLLPLEIDPEEGFFFERTFSNHDEYHSFVLDARRHLDSRRFAGSLQNNSALDQTEVAS